MFINSLRIDLPTKKVIVPDRLRVGKRRLIDALNAEGIPIEEEYYRQLHLEEVFASSMNYGEGKLPITEKTFPNIIAMPAFRAGTKKPDVDYFIDGFRKVFAAYSR